MDRYGKMAVISFIASLTLYGKKIEIEDVKDSNDCIIRKNRKHAPSGIRTPDLLYLKQTPYH